MNQPFTIAIHGGAGTLVKGMMTPETERDYTQALEKALDIGYAVLEGGGTATDAVLQSVMALEDSPLFNAGKGSVFTAGGTHEMDAAIMDGMDRSFGAACTVQHIKHPINLARKIM